MACQMFYAPRVGAVSRALAVRTRTPRQLAATRRAHGKNAAEWVDRYLEADHATAFPSS